MFIPSKDKIDEVYASIQEYFKIEDDEYLNKYLGIELDRRTDGSIRISQPCITQRIINMIPGMDKSSANPIFVVKPTLAKH